MYEELLSIKYIAVENLDSRLINFLVNRCCKLSFPKDYSRESSYFGWDLIEEIDKQFLESNSVDSKEVFEKDHYNKVNDILDIIIAHSGTLTFFKSNGYCPLSTFLSSKAPFEFIEKVLRHTNIKKIRSQIEIKRLIYNIGYVSVKIYKIIDAEIQQSKFQRTLEERINSLVRSSSNSTALEKIKYVCDGADDISAFDRWGHTPLDWAIYYENYELASFFKKSGIIEGKLDPKNTVVRETIERELDRVKDQIGRISRMKKEGRFSDDHSGFMLSTLNLFLNTIDELDQYDPDGIRGKLFYYFEIKKELSFIDRYLVRIIPQIRRSTYYKYWSLSIKEINKGLSPESYIWLYYGYLLELRLDHKDAHSKFDNIPWLEFDRAVSSMAISLAEFDEYVDGYIFSKNYRRALDVLQIFEKDNLELIQPYHKLRIGWCIEELSGIVAAEQHYRTMLVDHYDYLPAHRELIKCLCRQDLYFQAEIACWNVLEDSDDIGDIILRAKIKYHSSNYEEASDLILEALYIDPANKEALKLQKLIPL